MIDSFATNVNDASTTVTNFGFFQINYMSLNVFYPANGILGFAPISSALTGPSYVKALYD